MFQGVKSVFSIVPEQKKFLYSNTPGVLNFK